MHEQEYLIWLILGIIFASVVFSLLVIGFSKLIHRIKEKAAKQLCKNDIHNWVPVFIKGTYNGKEMKFIGCYCKRCNLGYNECGEMAITAENRKYGTYSIEYFK